MKLEFRVYGIDGLEKRQIEPVQPGRKAGR
jgi:hypothetical protein